MPTETRQQNLSGAISLIVICFYATTACDRHTSRPGAVQSEASGTARSGARQDTETITVRDPQMRLFEKPSSVGTAANHLHEYRFTTNWFTPNIPLWVAILEPLVGKPDLRYLEVGVYEGRSLFWIIDHVLTHETSRAVAIEPVVKEELLTNIELSGAKDRIELIRGFSGPEMRKLEMGSFDVIYIDGSHVASAVLEDMVQGWRLLKPGGLMILDDYLWKGCTDTRDGRTLAPDLVPRIAIDGFLSAYRSLADVVYKGLQVVLRKREGTCANQTELYCVSLGPYDYDWVDRTLKKGEEKIVLLDRERDTIEKLIRSRHGGGTVIELPGEFARSRELRSLDARLQLGLFPRSQGQNPAGR